MRRAVEAVAVSVTPKRTISGTPKRMGTRCSMKMPSGGARGCTRGDAFSPGSASMESRKSDTRRALPCIDASDGRQTADVGSMIGVVRSAAAVNASTPQRQPKATSGREIACTSLLFTNLKWTREHTTTHSTQEGHAGRCEHAEELARADAHRKRAGDTDFSTVLEREAGYVCAVEG